MRSSGSSPRFANQTTRQADRRQPQHQQHSCRGSPSRPTAATTMTTKKVGRGSRPPPRAASGHGALTQHMAICNVKPKEQERLLLLLPGAWRGRGGDRGSLRGPRGRLTAHKPWLSRISNHANFCSAVMWYCRFPSNDMPGSALGLGCLDSLPAHCRRSFKAASLRPRAARCSSERPDDHGHHSSSRTSGSSSSRNGCCSSRDSTEGTWQHRGGQQSRHHGVCVHAGNKKKSSRTNSTADGHPCVSIYSITY
jgi:hypothetical protein